VYVAVELNVGVAAMTVPWGSGGGGRQSENPYCEIM